MKQTEVFLMEYVDSLGGEGDVVKVRPGYARNYLLPRGLAIPVNMANKKLVEARKKARQTREIKMLDDAKAVATGLEKLNLAFAVKTGDEGKLFGSVTAHDVLERLKEEGFEIEKKKFHLAPIKTLGQHTAKIRLHPEISLDLNFEVVSENPIQEKASVAAAK